MVHAMPLDTPRPLKYNWKLSKNIFLWKSWFINFSLFFVLFWACRIHPRVLTPGLHRLGDCTSVAPSHTHQGPRWRFSQTPSNKQLLSLRYEKTHAPYCPFRPKNLKTYCWNMFGWFEEVGGTRKNHTSRCLWSLNYLATRKRHAPENNRDLSYQQKQNGPIWCHLVSIRIPFFEPKNKEIELEVASWVMPPSCCPGSAAIWHWDTRSEVFILWFSDIEEKRIKGSWIDPGQNGWFWEPFLVHWKVSLPKNMKMKRFNYLMRQKIEDPGPIKLRTIFPHTSVLSKPPQLPHGVNKSIFSCVLERPSPNLFLWKNHTRHLSRVAPLDTHSTFPLDFRRLLWPHSTNDFEVPIQT